MTLDGIVKDSVLFLYNSLSRKEEFILRNLRNSEAYRRGEQKGPRVRKREEIGKQDQERRRAMRG